MKYNPEIHKRENNLAVALFNRTGVKGVENPTHIYKFLKNKKLTKEVRLINFEGMGWWINEEEYNVIKELLRRFDEVSRAYWQDEEGRHYVYKCLDKSIDLGDRSPLITIVRPQRFPLNEMIKNVSTTT